MKHLIFVLLIALCSGAPDVTTYQALRAKPCSVGNTESIASGRYAGTFDCVPASQAWRTPFFDDGGIQFASATPGNIWKRKFAYSQTNPIHLEWYESIVQNARVDQLVLALTNDFAPNVYIEGPSAPGVTRLAWPVDVNLSGKTKRFFFTEGETAVTFYKNPNTSGIDGVSFLRNDGGDVIYIGGDELNMTFDGAAGFRTATTTTSRPSTEDALSFYACGERGGTFSSLTVKVNVKSPLGGTLSVGNSGCSQAKSWQNVVWGGVHEAAIRANSGFVNVHLDDIVVQDPLVRRYGWTGTSSGSNNSGSAYKEGGTGRVQKGGKLTGEMTLQYGIKFFWAKLSQVGNSASDPFVIHYRDNCYSGPQSAFPGTKVSTSGINGNISKMDDLGTTGKYWYSLDQAGDTKGNGCGNTFFDFESSKNGSAANSGVTLTSSGLKGSGDIIDTAICQGGDRDDNHTIKGGPLANTGRVRMVDTVTLTGGTFKDVLVTKDTCSGSGDNTITSVTLTGAVSITGGVKATTFQNVTFTGASRKVIDIGSGSDVVASGLKAPSGSTISGSGTLRCGSSPVNLPFTFDGNADACEGTGGAPPPPPPPPPPADAITVTSPNGGESWEIGSAQRISWTDNLTGSVSISLVGASTVPIIGATASDGEYDYVVPASVAPGAYRVRIAGGAASDDSDGTFMIVTPPPPPPPPDPEPEPEPEPDCTDEVQALQIQLNSLSIEIGILTSQLGDKDTAIALKESEIATLRADLATATASMNALQSKLAQIHSLSQP